MKLDKWTTDQIIGMQDKCHSIIDRLKKNKYHLESYEKGFLDFNDKERDCTEVSVIQQLYAASACFEMIIERLDRFNKE